MRDTFINLNTLKLQFNINDYHGKFLYWGYYNGLKWWRNYLHTHSFFEICYVLNGAGEFKINSKTINIKKGDLFIAKPNELHEIISLKKQPLEIYFWAYTFIKPTSFKSNDLSVLFNAFFNSDIQITNNSERVLHILNALNAESQFNQIGYATQIESLVNQLIVEVARVYTNEVSVENPSTPLSRNDVVVSKIIRYLNDNYATPLTLNQISAQVYLSEKQTSRIFKKVKGVTIKAYAMDVRLNMAKQLLVNSTQSVANIAFETGFQDSKHFSTVFKEKNGLTPSLFRQKNGTIFLD